MLNYLCLISALSVLGLSLEIIFYVNGPLISSTLSFHRPKTGKPAIRISSEEGKLPKIGQPSPFNTKCLLFIFRERQQVT